MTCIKKIQIEDTIYNADIHFKTAIKCNEIATDKTIGNYERALGIIYTMFGEKGLNSYNHHDKLLKWCLNYLSCGKEIEKKQKPDMDYVEDYDLIWTSFMSDYNGLDIDKVDMDWQRFNKLINGLSNSELGNCCILNRVRLLRNYDVSKIKDPIEKDKIIKAKEQVALKKYQKEVVLTEKQQQSVDEFYKALGY